MESAKVLYEELYESDAKLHQVCSLITSGIDTFSRLSGKVNLGPDGEDELIRRVTVVGSAREGCICPRMLTSKESSIETDLMISAVTVPADKTEELVVLLEDKPGFCKIKTKELLQIIHPIVKEKFSEFLAGNDLEPLENEEFLNGRTVKRLTEDVCRYRDADGTLNEICDHVFGEGPLYEAKQCIEFHGPSTNLTMQLYKKDELIITASIDFVMILQMESLPEVVQPWTVRPRHWPDDALVQEAVAHGCQIVAKPAKSDELVDHDEWRFTFTKIENHLACKRSKEQQLVYLIAKCIHYKHLCVKHRDSEFSSYCLKTCLMWMLEDTSPERWTTEDAMVLVSELYKRLNGYLTDGHVPHYFIPSLNLLAEYPDELVATVGEKTKGIVGDLLGHLPNEDEVRAMMGKSDLLLTFIKDKMPSVVQYFVEKRIKNDFNRTRDRYEESINKFFGRLRSYNDEDLD